MIGIRPYKASDVDTILSWCQDETAFYQWTAGILGNYPITQKEFCFVESLMPFTAFDETGIVGFFTLRNSDERDIDTKSSWCLLCVLFWGSLLFAFATQSLHNF